MLSLLDIRVGPVGTCRVKRNEILLDKEVVSQGKRALENRNLTLLSGRPANAFHTTLAKELQRPDFCVRSNMELLVSMRALGSPHLISPARVQRKRH